MAEIVKLVRRNVLKGAAAAALTPIFSPYVMSQGISRPLKIGFATSFSGPFAGMGENMRTGLELMIKENGGKFGDRPLELIIEDDQTKPDEAVRKVRKFIGQDKVDVICGFISSAIGLAIRDVVTDAKVLTIYTVASSNDLARKATSPYIFRPTKSNWMLGHTAGLWAYDNVEKDGCITVGADYVAGREYVGDFVAAYQAKGGKIAKQYWTPLGTTDFGPMLTSIAADRPKFVYPFFAGSDAVRFMQQFKEYRLSGRIKLVGTVGPFDQEDVLPAVGDAANGAILTAQVSPTAPVAAPFVEAWKKVRGRVPGEMAFCSYTTGQIIKMLTEKLNGDLSNIEKVRQVMLEKPVDTVMGPMTFDPRNQQAILDIYVNEVRPGADGKPIHQVIHTYKGVKDPGPPA